MEYGNIKLIDMKEFIDGGYLQEANRLFFHPLGLSMIVRFDDDGDSFVFGGFMDCRDDKEGIIFGPSLTEDQSSAREAKSSKISSEMSTKASVRVEKFGWDVQPVSDLLVIEKGSDDGAVGH